MIPLAQNVYLSQKLDTPHQEGAQGHDGQGSGVHRSIGRRVPGEEVALGSVICQKDACCISRKKIDFFALGIDFWT